VGRDSRATSAEFQAAFIEGLISTGCNVLDIGLSRLQCCTGRQYHFQTDGGAAITASHNPAGWNGLKLAVGLSMTTNSEQLREIYRVIESEEFVSGRGKVTETPIDDAYIEDIVSGCASKASRRFY